VSLSNHLRRTAAWALLAFALAGCSGGQQPSPQSSAPLAPQDSKSGAKASADQPSPGFQAADIAATDAVTGKPVELSSLKGQVVMLNFWATWCMPCRQEMPAMEQFQKEVQGKVKVLALGGDSSEAPDKLAAYAGDLGLTFTILHDGGTAVNAYRVFGLPTTFFIDQNGIIRSRHTGALTLPEMRQLAEETERMGKEQ
jgi:thiol-disulfide isomerase/thioredoxin